MAVGPAAGQRIGIARLNWRSISGVITDLEDAVKALFGLLLVCVVPTVLADSEQRLNPMSGQWETVSPGAELRLNPISGQFDYASPGAEPRYVPERSGAVMMAPGDVQKFNPTTGHYETTQPNAELRYN